MYRESNFLFKKKQLIIQKLEKCYVIILILQIFHCYLIRISGDMEVKNTKNTLSFNAKDFFVFTVEAFHPPLKI